jgi:hypothetical protein
MENKCPPFGQDVSAICATCVRYLGNTCSTFRQYIILGVHLILRDIVIRRQLLGSVVINRKLLGSIVIRCDPASVVRQCDR